jgi:hypothetical protein
VALKERLIDARYRLGLAATAHGPIIPRLLVGRFTSQTGRKIVR